MIGVAKIKARNAAFGVGELANLGARIPALTQMGNGVGGAGQAASSNPPALSNRRM